MAPQLLQSAHSWDKLSKKQECYEFVVVSRKNACQTCSSLTLRHKTRFPYEYPCREAMTVLWGATMSTLMGRALRQNFGNIRGYYANTRGLLEQIEALAALLFRR